MYLQTQGTDTQRWVSRYEVNWEIGIHIYALPYVKVIACGKLLYSAWSSAWCSVMTQMDGMEVGWKGGPKRRGLLLLLGRPVVSDSATPRTAARKASLSLTISQSLRKFMFTASVMPSSDSLFSFCPQSFPASGTFPVSGLFESDDQNTGASTSASVLIGK